MQADQIMKLKKILIYKAWIKRCSLSLGMIKIIKNSIFSRRSINSNCNCKVTPEGCFSVYVGEEKQKFVIKTELVNHPLFKMLLEDAEMEYGYNYFEGPILLPCNVDLFYKVLAEIQSRDDDDDHEIISHRYGSLINYSSVLAYTKVLSSSS